MDPSLSQAQPQPPADPPQEDPDQLLGESPEESLDQPPADPPSERTEQDLANEIMAQAKAEEVAEPELAAESEDPPEEPAEPELKAEEAPLPEFSSWEELDTVAQSLSPRDRSLVEKVSGIAKRQEDLYKGGLKLLGEKQAKLDAVLGDLEEHGFDGAKAMGNSLKEAYETRDHLALENGAMAWKAFQRLHPEYEHATPQFRETFASVMEQVNTLFKGETVLDRLEEAFEWTAFKTKGRPAAPTTATSQAQAETKPATPPKATAPAQRKAETVTVARKQAAMSDGRHAFNLAARTIDDISVNEILSRNERLLED